MRIQTNTAANSALGYMRTNNMATERSIQKLSSGFRINRAADDAAGLAIANKLRSDIKGLGQASRNVAQGTAMLQTMDGATQTVSSILDRMKELATQANSANIGTQSDKLQSEFGQLRSEIDRIAGTTNYQGTKLLDGTFGYTVSAGTPAVAAVAGAVNGGGATGFTGVTASVGTQSTFNASGITGNLTLTATATGIDVSGGGLSSPISVAISASEYSSGATKTIGSTGLSFTIAASTTAPSAGAAGSIQVTAPVAAQAAVAAGTVSGTTGSFMVSSSGNYAFGQSDQIQVQAVNLNTGAAGLALSTLDISTQTGAAAALTAIDGATDTLNKSLGSIGAAQSRMDFAAANVATQLQNTQAAESTIRDADMAEEMTKFTKNNVLQQAAQSMLSQANQGTQGILQLLRG